MDDIFIQSQFVEKQSKANIDRIAKTLLTDIVKKSGLKILGSPQKVDDQWSVLADVVKPNEMFDHIEIKISITGWGRIV